MRLIKSNIWKSNGSFSPLLQLKKFPDILVSTQEEHESPEQVTVTKARAPAFTMGIRHSKRATTMAADTAP